MGQPYSPSHSPSPIVLIQHCKAMNSLTPMLPQLIWFRIPMLPQLMRLILFLIRFTYLSLQARMNQPLTVLPGRSETAD